MPSWYKNIVFANIVWILIYQALKSQTFYYENSNTE